jgi:hypothetical protein
MFNIIVNSSTQNPIQKLKAAQDAPLEQFCILVSTEEIEELSEYVKEVTYDPGAIRDRIKKLLLLYIAAIRYIILSFEPEDVPEGLLEHCDALAKTLYIFYKDINIILITKEIKACWKTYNKLNAMALKVSEKSNRRVDQNRDRLLIDLKQLSNRVKSL